MEFKDRVAKEQKAFVDDFRSKVDIDMLNKLYKFFQTDDLVELTDEGMEVVSQASDASMASLEIRDRINFSKEYYKTVINSIFKSLANAPEKVEVKKAKPTGK